MFRQRAALVLAAVSLLPASLAAQSFNLRDLLTDFFRQGITLAEPPAGSPFPSHAHHFVGDASLVPLEQLNSELASQLSTFPLASSAGGFTYQLDPALGVLTRATDSFGPIFAERADSIGKGKFAIGLNFSHFAFDRIDDLRLRDGDIQIVLRHQDLPPAGCCLRPFFEGDVIVTSTLLKIQTDITAFTLTYGVTDRLDIGAAIPVVRVQIQARTEATIDTENSRVSLPVSGGADELVRAVQVLGDAGISLADIALRRPTLDDVFLTLTGHTTTEPSDSDADAPRETSKS